MSEVFVAELDPLGAHAWSHSFGGARYQYAAGLVVDDQGNVFVTGQFSSGAVDFGGEPLEAVGTSDGFIVKLGDQGGHVWSRRFGGELIQFPGDLALDSRGNPVITGSFSGLLELGDDLLASAGHHDLFVAVLRP
ncbi:MAG: SBBP repeat-containing protein [Deltaproteobacteria bacterium]|nr:SBBP repeat-containing protein [Deltaproteobacteria bacterium]